jgi:hypothetical protein
LELAATSCGGEAPNSDSEPRADELRVDEPRVGEPGADFGRTDSPGASVAGSVEARIAALAGIVEADKPATSRTTSAISRRPKVTAFPTASIRLPPGSLINNIGDPSDDRRQDSRRWYPLLPGSGKMRFSGSL